MIIAVAFDHGGFALKETVLQSVRNAGDEPGYASGVPT